MAFMPVVEFNRGFGLTGACFRGGIVAKGSRASKSARGTGPSPGKAIFWRISSLLAGFRRLNESKPFTIKILYGKDVGIKATHESNRRKIIAGLMQAGREEMRLAILWGNAAAESMGIHPTDAISVTFLNEVGETTAGELAKVTGLTTGAMTAAIDRLERAGWAVRTVDPRDRRKVIVKGIKLSGPLVALRAAIRKEFEATLSCYGDAELLRFIEFRNITNALLKRAIELHRDRRVRSFLKRRK